MKRSQLVKLILVMGGCLIVVIMWRLHDGPSAACKATEEFLDKALVIIATHKGDNLDRRLAELRLEYDSDLARVSAEVQTGALKAIAAAMKLQRLRDELQEAGVSDENWKQRWKEAEKEWWTEKKKVDMECLAITVPFK